MTARLELPADADVAYIDDRLRTAHAALARARSGEDRAKWRDIIDQLLDRRAMVTSIDGLVSGD